MHLHSYGLCVAAGDSVESPLSPPPPSTDSSGSIRGRHHRVRSITSKQDMVPQRPASARARILPVVVMQHQTPTGSGSPLNSHLQPLLSQSPSPPHNSEPVTTDDMPAACIGDEKETETAGGSTVEMEEQDNNDDQKEIPFELVDGELKGRVRKKITPLSVSQLVQPSSLSTSPQKTLLAEHLHTFSDSQALSSSDEYSREEPVDSRPRKGSEPPPSLLALFERDMGSSRRTQKQHSSDDGAVHPKQHSFDCNHLMAPQAHGSPKHRRRVKSPAPSASKRDKEKAMTRTPSHPHLHQTTSTPHFPHILSVQPLTKAHSIQQLRTGSPCDSEEAPIHRSYSVGRDDMKLLKPDMGGLITSKPDTSKPDTAGLITSKESFHNSRESNISSVGSLKVKSDVKRASKEDLTTREERVISQRQLSVDSVPIRSPAKSYQDMWRRNSTQIGTRREEGSGVKGNVRPRSMVETSALRPHYPVEFNPTPSALVAQMFWTAVSLLESDFEAEFSMALRLISKVYVCIYTNVHAHNVMC